MKIPVFFAVAYKFYPSFVNTWGSDFVAVNTRLDANETDPEMQHSVKFVRG